MSQGTQGARGVIRLCLGNVKQPTHRPLRKGTAAWTTNRACLHACLPVRECLRFAGNAMSVAANAQQRRTPWRTSDEWLGSSTIRRSRLVEEECACTTSRTFRLTHRHLLQQERATGHSVQRIAVPAVTLSWGQSRHRAYYAKKTPQLPILVTKPPGLFRDLTLQKKKTRSFGRTLYCFLANCGEVHGNDEPLHFSRRQMVTRTIIFVCGRRRPLAAAGRSGWI